MSAKKEGQTRRRFYQPRPLDWLLFASYLFGLRMTLEFSLPEVASLSLAFGVVVLISGDGECNWFEGAKLLAVYLIIAVLFFSSQHGKRQPRRRMAIASWMKLWSLPIVVVLVRFRVVRANSPLANRERRPTTIRAGRSTNKNAER
jgi:hypothetical protein